MTKPKVIAVASGKGGTGKTLLTAVIAEQLGNRGVEILVVDMDVFVRGLTSLLYYHKREARRLTEQGESSVAEFFLHGHDRHDSSQEPDLSRRELKLSISRYRSFDVAPAVSLIDEVLTFGDIFPNTRDEALETIHCILDSIDKEYDIVILDCRAGYDELIAATHEASDLTLVVEEDDSISRVTSDNLVRQLQRDAPKVPLFRVINKARHITRAEELERESEREMREIASLGLIPFDIDVMNSFGSPTFWSDISNTLFRVALERVWNRLNQRMQLNFELQVVRTSPLVSERLERRLKLVSLRDRVILVYGLIIAIAGFAVAFVGMPTIYQFFNGFSPDRLFALVLGVLGLTLSLWAAFRQGLKR